MRPAARVARLIRRIGLKGATRGKAVRTTISDKAAPCPLDRVKRQFLAPHPTALWVADFTYVATWQGFVYVACLFRRIRQGVSVESAHRFGETAHPNRKLVGAGAEPWIYVMKVVGLVAKHRP